jgi:hypothetical protein
LYCDAHFGANPCTNELAECQTAHVAAAVQHSVRRVQVATIVPTKMNGDLLTLNHNGRLNPGYWCCPCLNERYYNCNHFLSFGNLQKIQYL